MGRIWGLFGGPLGGLRGSLWGPFWGLFGGLAGKTPSKAILEPFRGHSGGPVGGENDHFDWEGCRKSAFPPFRVGAHFGSLQEPSWARFGTPNGAHIAPKALPEPTLKLCFEKDPPKSPNWAPRALQDPPKIPPIRAQEAPKRARKGVQNGSDSQLPSRTPRDPVWDPFGVHLGTILGAILGPFGEPFWSHSLARTPRKM